jgi:NADH:ubiquinone reductase (H+-translocating)
MSAENGIVIVGGGFAGTALARSLERRVATAQRVVLISEESYTTFNPMLAEVVGASVFPEHVVAPIRQMLRAGGASQFIMGRVTGVDFGRRCIQAATLAGDCEIDYRHLVFAFGSRANLDLVPGLARHALPLKLVGDAMFIRNRVLQRVARIELEPDPVVRRRLGHFIVIGGGFSGVEVAGSLADFLRGAARYYPRVQPHELKVTVIETGSRLLPELPASLGKAAACSMRSRRIGVRLKCRAERIEADGVALAGGEFIEGATVICTTGTRPNPLVERLDVAQQRGRIVTAPDLSVVGNPGVWAIGDCALVHNGLTQQWAPPTAQFAVAQAKALARNIAASNEGRPTRPFRHRSRGMMATTGHLKGVAQLFGVRLHGLPAWLLWRAYYLLLMPTLGRKVRIWLEWTWSMFFAVDITHLRFTRTSETDAPAPHAGVDSSFQPQSQM